VIFTDSAFSRDEILRYIPVEPSRVQVIAPGVSARHGHTAPARREPLVLFTGTVLNRRRLPQLIAAFALLAGDRPTARLIVVGANRTWPHEDLGAIAAAQGVAARVEVRHYVSDNELADLYCRASVFAFLSEYEGFGLTPLEALAAGIPSVVLETPVAREVYGPAVLYVPPEAGVRGIAQVLRDALDGADYVRAALGHAAGIVSRYSWDQAADRTLAAIEATARP